MKFVEKLAIESPHHPYLCRSCVTAANSDEIYLETFQYLRSLRKKCPYSEFFWTVFYRIHIEYGKIPSISPNSVRLRENADQKNSEYGHLLRSGYHSKKVKMEKGKY